MKKSQQDLRKLEQIEIPAGFEDDEPVTNSPIYESFKSEGLFEELTNFHWTTIEEIWRPLNAHMEANKHRGPNAHTSTMDHLLCYLVWMKSGSNYTELATLLGMSPTRFEDNLNRVRGALNETLEMRWWRTRERPRYQGNPDFPPVGLIVDGHTTQIGQPSLNYQDAKVFWDGHNHMYGLKTEVAVHPSKPHYCMFASPHVPASRHDYDLHKEVFRHYIPYLTMTDEELARRPQDVNAQHWAIMADKGYTGPQDDTYPIRRIVPYRGIPSEAQAVWNRQVSERRVVVEMFLGRLSTLWAAFRVTWRWDHEHFDIDFANACMLTNHHLEDTHLSEDDHSALLQLKVQRITELQNQRVKKAASARASKRKRANWAIAMRDTEFGPPPAHRRQSPLGPDSGRPHSDMDF